MDPLPALIATEAARRVLGPSLEVVGSRLAGLTESMIDNVGRVLRSAMRKLRDDATNSFPARTLTVIWEEAPFAEDQVAQEYFGGVLASARSAVGRDDTAAIWAKQIAVMSSYTLRLHYTLYSAARAALVGTELNFGVDQTVYGGVFLTFDQVERGMELGPLEDFGNVLRHAFVALRNGNYIGQSSAYGLEKDLSLATKGAPIPEPGLVFYPTNEGIGLWLVAHGYGGLANVDLFVDSSAVFEVEPGLPTETGTSTAMLRGHTRPLTP